MKQDFSIELLVLEVDGVLTDGRAWPDARGEWRRRFSVRDSLALRSLRRSGARIAILTRSRSADVASHAALVGIDDCIQDCDDKPGALRALIGRHGIEASRAAAIIECQGDAWMSEELGCVIATQSANEAVRRAAFYVTQAEGGDGAVREACNVLRQGWETLLSASLAVTRSL